MSIRDIVSNGVAACTEDTPLVEVYEMVQASADGYVIVIDSTKHRVPIGFVSEHSICENLVRNRRATHTLDAGNVMSSQIERVGANTKLEDCEQFLLKAVNRIVVVDERRRFMGVVDREVLRSSIDRASLQPERPRFAYPGALANSIPGVVEIPAFGWLK